MRTEYLVIFVVIFIHSYVYHELKIRGLTQEIEEIRYWIRRKNKNE